MLLKTSFLLLCVSYANKNFTDFINDQKNRGDSARPTKKPRKEIEKPKIAGWEPNGAHTAPDWRNKITGLECQGNAFYDMDLYNNYDLLGWPFRDLRPWFGSCGKKFNLFHPEIVKVYAGEEVDTETCFYTENYGDRFVNNFWVDTNGYVVLLREKFFDDMDDYIYEGDSDENGLDSRPNSCKSMIDDDIMVFSVYRRFQKFFSVR